MIKLGKIPFDPAPSFEVVLPRKMEIVTVIQHEKPYFYVLSRVEGPEDIADKVRRKFVTLQPGAVVEDIENELKLVGTINAISRPTIVTNPNEDQVVELTFLIFEVIE